MKISIITPSYNQGKYIEETILSVVSQKGIELEYIIIDGDSTDGSVEIIKKYEKSISYWVSEPDKGQSDAISKGLKKATGEIVAWLNSDDTYLPGSLSFVADFFEKHPEVDLIYGNVEQLYEGGKTEDYIVKEFEPLDLLSRVSIHQPSVFWLRRLHDEIGFLDETLYYLMDYDLWIRLFFNYKTARVNKVLSRFRLHKNAKSYANPPGLYHDYRKIISIFFNSVKNTTYKNKLISNGLYVNPADTKYALKNTPAENTLKTALRNFLFNCAIQEHTFGDRKKANKLFLKSISLRNIHKALYFLTKNNFFYAKIKQEKKTEL